MNPALKHDAYNKAIIQEKSQNLDGLIDLCLRGSSFMLDTCKDLNRTEYKWIAMVLFNCSQKFLTDNPEMLNLPEIATLKECVEKKLMNFVEDNSP